MNNTPTPLQREVSSTHPSTVRVPPEEPWKISSLWAPGLRLMGSISFATKTRIIVSAFLLPIALLGWSVWQGYRETRNFTTGELQGLQLMKALVPLSRQFVLAHNTTLARKASPGLATAETTVTNDVNSLFSQLEQEMQRTPESQNLLAALSLMHQSWDKAKAATPEGRVSGASTVFAPAVTQSTELLQLIADQSGMILDPDIDTLYLCLASIQALPMLVEGIGQIRAWSTYLAANASKLSPLELSIARQRYAVWDADVRTALKNHKAFIEKITAYNPSTRNALDLTFLAAAEDYRAQAYAAVDTPAPEDAVHLWNLGETVFEQSHAQYQAVFPTLEVLLKQRLQRIDSKQWWLTLSAVLTLSFAGYLFYSFYKNTVRDMAQKKLEEAALRQAMHSAEQANLAKSQFLANMSHEIRTPMNGVLGMTDLAYELAQDATQKTYLQTVKSSAESLLVILNEILDFSKIEAGQLHIETIPLDLCQVVTQTMAGLQARLKKKQLTLECDIAHDLPPSMMGDPGRIRQVLTNLCDNAIKFTQTGGLVVQVQWNAQPLEGLGAEQFYAVRIAVRDTGVGIAPEKQRLIFEAFSQADTSTTREYGGTGLGLTISARLVELMGGKITVESAPGEGSTFAFTMRLGQVAQQDVPEIAPAVAPADSPPNTLSTNTTTQLRTLKVLLVEDHPVNQLLASTLLKKMGHSVIVANNGQEAVDLFPTTQWDIVLMDLQMPVMGGLQAAPLIRALEPTGQRTPIIAVTANAMDSDREACLGAGMDAHLAKPIRSAELQETISRFCQT